MKRSYAAVLRQSIRTANIILDNPDRFNAISLAGKLHVSVKTVRSYLRLIRIAYDIYPEYDRTRHTLTYIAPQADSVALLNRIK